MPNHVKTIIRLSGDKDQVKRLLEAHITKTKATLESDHGKHFDFETIIPMPENVFRGNLGQEEERIHGRNNWYHWSIDNWGTKWNSYDFIQLSAKIFSFQTAWAFPFPVIQKLSTMYPDVKMHIMYADEDIGSNYGKFYIQNGLVDNLDVNDGASFGRRVWRNK
jgi:hypothetical protein